MGPAVKEGRSERSVASCIDGEGRGGSFVKALSIWFGDPAAGYWRLEGQEGIAKIMNEYAIFGGGAGALRLFTQFNNSNVHQILKEDGL